MAYSSLLHAITDSGPITFSIFLFLVLLSLISWGVIVAKMIQFVKIKQSDSKFLEHFQKAKNIKELQNQILSLDQKSTQGLFFIFSETCEVIDNFRKRTPDLNFINPDMKTLKANLEEAIVRTLVRARTIEYHRKETALVVLATCSNVAPFIGLLGTVIGIINAFSKIGEAGSADLTFIAPAISEALVATALGLFVAIPASIAFNYFKNQGQNYRESYNNFSLILENKIQQYFLPGEFYHGNEVT